MQVQPSHTQNWFTECFKTLSSVLGRITAAVLKAFGCLDTQPKKPDLINASSPFKPASPVSLKIDAVKDKIIVSEKKAAVHQTDSMSDADLAKFEETTNDTKSDLTQHELVPIVEKPMPAAVYAKKVYRDNLDPRFDTPKARADFAPKRARNVNYQKRLLAISNRFHTPHVYPVRGDGNCFCNAAVAGIITCLVKRPELKSSIITKIKNAEASNFPYITSDTSHNALEYGVNFSKANDFKKVLKKLEDQTDLEILNDFDFTSKFSRVIRYMLLIEGNNQDAQLRTFGNEMEATFIYGLYRIFNLNIKLAVLENNNQLVDPKDPNEYGVTDPLDEINNTKNDKADFVIVLKSAHYFAMINLID